MYVCVDAWLHMKVRVCVYMYMCNHRKAGNFHGIQFLWMASIQSFLFADASDHAHYTLYNHTYFMGLIFADSRLSAKTTKISCYTV